LASLLPFGGLHSDDAKEHLDGLVPSRLEKNQKLKRELEAGMEYVTIVSNSIDLSLILINSAYNNF
jgi:hypothetical protein